MLLPALGRGSWRAVTFAFLPLTLGIAVVRSLANSTLPTLFVVSGGYSLFKGARSPRKKGYAR